MRRRALALLTVGLATVVLLGVAPAEATTVAFDEIGPATPGTTVTAGDRNEAGQVTGSTVFAVGRHAYRRSAGGTLTDLGVLGTGTSSSGAALNGSGAVVGTTATTPGGDFRAFLWTESAGMVDLGVLGGDTESSGIDINGSGWIVGRSDGRGWVRDPADGVLVDVGTLPGATTIQMVAINDAGVALGAAFVPGGIIGFTWTEADGIRALPLPDGVAGFRPSAITDAGQVLGTDFDLADGYRTWLWDPLIGFTELAGPAGFASVFGADVNERGVVVGFAEDAADDRSLAVWDTVRSPTATVLPSPTAGSIDASIDVVTDTGGLLASTNEIVDEDDVERAYVGQLALAPDQVTTLFRSDCSGPVELGWWAPAFDGYAPVSYDVQRDGITIATVTGTSYVDTPHPETVTYAVVAFTAGGRAAAQPVNGGSSCRPPSTTTTTNPPSAPPANPVVVDPRFAG